MISEYIPICRNESKYSNNDLIIVPTRIAFILQVLLPIASNEKESGACIYWNRMKGARMRRYSTPFVVLYISFKKYYGNIINVIVTGIPINKEKNIPWYIFLFVSLYFLFTYSFVTTGSNACDIASVKKDGNNKSGNT